MNDPASGERSLFQRILRNASFLLSAKGLSAVFGLLYLAMLAIPRWWVRAFAVGALWHLAVDYGDCVMQTL